MNACKAFWNSGPPLIWEALTGAELRTGVRSWKARLPLSPVCFLLQCRLKARRPGPGGRDCLRLGARLNRRREHLLV